MRNQRSRFQLVAVAAIVAAGLVLLPQVARSVTPTIVQLADRSNPAIKAAVNSRHQLVVSKAGIGLTVTHFGPVSLGAGAARTFPAKPAVGGRLSVFVKGSSAGTLAAIECVPIPTKLQCAVDFTGQPFAGDGKLHQGLDASIEGSSWELKLKNAGTSSGTYTITVVERPSV
jgi:hypothetical protein